MEITREKACQRLHHRIATPLNLYHDGRHYGAADWSLGGFRVGNWDRLDSSIEIGDQQPWKFELPFQGFMIAFDVVAEVVRIDGASYRAKEADERNVLRKAERATKASASRSRKAAR